MRVFLLNQSCSHDTLADTSVAFCFECLFDYLVAGCWLIGQNGLVKIAAFWRRALQFDNAYGGDDSRRNSTSYSNAWFSESNDQDFAFRIIENEW